MNSGKDSAECSMCHQLVHFDPSDKDEGAEADELSSPTNVDDDFIEIDEEVAADEPSVDEQESDELVTDDEAHPKPANAPLEEEEPAPRTLKRSTVAISSGSEALSETATPSQSGEEKFRKMDEAPRKRSSSSRRSSRSSKQRRVKNTVSRRDEFGWESDSRQRHRSDRTTILFVSSAVIAMVVLMVFLLTRAQSGNSESESAKLERQEQEEMLSQQASAMKGFLGDGKANANVRPRWQAEFNNSPDRFIRKLRPIIEGFLKAENWEDRLRFCADAETVRPLMEDYYKDNDDGPIGYQEVFYGGSVSVGEFFITANLLMDDYSDRGFVMLRDDDGSWSVDWESFVGYSTMSMAEFKKVRPTEPQLFRLTIKRPSSGYYNYEFSDEKSWDGYLLAGRNTEEILYAYVKKFSESASDLNEIFSMKREAAITLMIRFPEDAPSANQVEVVKVIGEGWVPTILRKSDAEER